MNELETFLKVNNIAAELINFDASTHSAQDAATTLGCDVGQIISTLIFTSEGEYFIGIIPGDRKVDMQKLKSLINKKRPELASREDVLKITGFPVGGVPCIFASSLPIFIDKSIEDKQVVYSGGGNPNTVMKIKSDDVFKFWGVEGVEISKER